MITANQMVNALDTIVYTYGLEDYLWDWKRPGVLRSVEGSLFMDYEMLENEPMLEMIWVICVELFGDWGVTPRAGWIDDAKGFCEFIDRITATASDTKQGGNL